MATIPTDGGALGAAALRGTDGAAADAPDAAVAAPAAQNSAQLPQPAAAGSGAQPSRVPKLRLGVLQPSSSADSRASTDSADSAGRLPPRATHSLSGSASGSRDSSPSVASQRFAVSAPLALR